MALSVNGNKKIATLKKEFNEHFPYLKLLIFCGNDRSYDYNYLTLGQMRTIKGNGSVSISGNKTIGALEKDFKTNFGLTAEVGFTDKNGKPFYTGSSYNSTTLSSLNTQCQKNKCNKGVWK